MIGKIWATIGIITFILSMIGWFLAIKHCSSCDEGNSEIIGWIMINSFPLYIIISLIIGILDNIWNWGLF